MKNVASDQATGPAAVPDAAGTSALPDVWLGIKLRVLPYRFPLAVIVTVGLVLAGQLVEDSLDSPPLQMLSGEAVTRWTIVLAVLYMVVILKFLERPVRRALAALQPVVKISPRDFNRYAARMAPPGARSGIAILVASGVLAAIEFPLAGIDLPGGKDPVTHAPTHLAGDPWLALVELAGYVILGWAGLRLVYGTIRLGRALGQLSREPLEVNVFDTTGLLPFGRIALAVALAPAGLIAILLFGFGQPQGYGWIVLAMATLASLLALVLPLRGVHHQMFLAKQSVLANVNRDITQIYAELNIPAASDAPALARLTNRTATLIALRKLVGDMTTWPFQDTVAFARAVLVACSPLIYTALNGLVTLFILNPLKTTP